MNRKLSTLGAVLAIAAACALPAGNALADEATKRALAVKLAQLQQKNDRQAITDQLTASAMQPAIIRWSQELEKSVPAARQQEVRNQLDVELKKFAEKTEKNVDANVAAAAESALVPVFMEKLSEDELKTIVTYLESPASTKFQNLGVEAGNAWAMKIIEATKDAVERDAKAFDTAAKRIIDAAATKKSAAPAKKPAKK